MSFDFGQDLRHAPRRLRAQPATATLAVALLALAIGMLGRLLAAVQYQVRLADPLTWSVVIISIALTTVLAAWRPASQAMRVDPLTLLREE